MNTDDLDLINDLRDLQGWDDLTTAFAVPAPTTDAVARATQTVREAAAAELPATAIPLAPRRHGRKLRWAVVAVAGVAAAALLVAAPTVSAPDNAPVATASAAQILHQLAAIVKPSAASTADYWRTEFVALSRMDAGAAGKTPHTTVIVRGRNGGQWLSYDGSSYIYTNLPPAFDLGRQSTIAWTELESLGNDAPSINAALNERVGASGVFDAAAFLLASAPLSSQQHQALFTILGDQPGLTMMRAGKDSIGRVGTAISKTEDGVTTTLILASDGTLYEIRYSTVEARTFDSQTVPAGGVVAFETYVSAGPANAAPASQSSVVPSPEVISSR